MKSCLLIMVHLYPLLFILILLLIPTLGLYSLTEWTLQNWLFDKVDEQLHNEIMNLGHWDIHPLAAYTPNDTLINPLNYQKELASAMVMMSFHLKYALP